MSFGLYVHWPFCAKKCPYCDFNSHVRSAIDEEGWADAVLAEMETVAGWQGGERPIVETIFFGGGTPSLMGARSLERILGQARRLWRFSNDIEITLEANPASSEATRFADYARAGVNRLSLGMQALNDADLKFLGRLHDTREAKAALAMAQKVFPRVSLDLIYARPGQSIAAWRAELAEALSFGTEHLSLYQLTVEPATPFALLHRSGALQLPDDDRAVALYEATQEITRDAGIPAYEVSNHARAGAEARHNLLYWRYGDYAGFGPGAHGRIEIAGKRVATMGEKLPERWRDRVTRDGHGYVERGALAPQDAAREHLLMNLRLREGIDLDAFRARWNWAPDLARISTLAQAGLLECKEKRLAVSPRGMLVLNRLIAELAD
jgi:putative oxygen-independent coproporphyrinogen III oxidase